MKKTIAALTLLFLIGVAHSAPLPNGVDAKIVSTAEENGHVTEALVANSVQVQTKFGTIPTKAHTKIGFYESGNIKSFHTGENIEVNLTSGNYVISSFESVSDSSKDIPITLDENGNLILAYLPETRYDKNAPKKNIAKTKSGNFELRQKSRVEFYPDGTLASGKVLNGQQVVFNGQQVKLTMGSKISFYENGNLKEFTPEKQLPCQGFEAKGKEPVLLYERGTVKSIVPAQKEVIELGDMTFYFSSNKPLEFTENEEILEMSVDCADKDFQYDNIRIKCKSAVKTIQDNNPEILQRRPSFATPSSSKNLTFTFYDDGALASLKAVAERGQFIFSPDGENFSSASEIKVHKNQNLAFVHYEPEVVVTEEKKLNAMHWFEFKKDFFDENGNLFARRGIEVTLSPKGNFYDKRNSVLCLVKNGTVIEKIYDSPLTDEEVAETYGKK